MMMSNCGNEVIMNDDRPFPLSTSNEWNVAQPVVNGTSPVGSGSPSGSTTGSKKILKHKQGLVEKVPNLKRVTFEIEKFVVNSIKNTEERTSAETQLAIRLGAKPAKRLPTNYKKLKSEREMEKNNNKLDEDSVLRLASFRNLNPKSKNLKKKKKNNKKSIKSG